MDIESVREYCLAKAEVTEGFPFGDDTLVFKVNNKMFALINLKGNLSINLKCDPEKAIALREHYEGVLPGYHMNKKQWNTVMLDYRIDNTLIKQWIDDSYNLVVQKMPKKDRERIAKISNGG
jgi:predicted DNA-binding protein (MmcQ/YjbR family)